VILDFCRAYLVHGRWQAARLPRTLLTSHVCEVSVIKSNSGTPEFESEANAIRGPEQMRLPLGPGSRFARPGMWARVILVAH